MVPGFGLDSLLRGIVVFSPRQGLVLKKMTPSSNRRRCDRLLGMLSASAMAAFVSAESKYYRLLERCLASRLASIRARPIGFLSPIQGGCTVKLSSQVAVLVALPVLYAGTVSGQAILLARLLGLR